MPSGNYIRLLMNYDSEPKKFFAIWTFDSNMLEYVLALVFTFVILIFCVSIIISVITRSFRIGVFKLHKPLTDFNDNFQPVFSASITYLFTLIAYKVVITTLLGLWKTIENHYLSLAISIITICIITILAAILTTHISLIVPIMSATGLKLKDAFLKSIQKVGESLVPISTGLWIPVMIKAILGSIIALTEIKYLLLGMDILLNTFLFSYLVVYILIVYYEIERIKREDYTPHYFEKRAKKQLSKD
jgi:hypothetical protein